MDDYGSVELYKSPRYWPMGGLCGLSQRGFANAALLSSCDPAVLASNCRRCMQGKWKNTGLAFCSPHPLLK